MRGNTALVHILRYNLAGFSQFAPCARVSTGGRRWQVLPEQFQLQLAARTGMLHCRISSCSSLRSGACDQPQRGEFLTSMAFRCVPFCIDCMPGLGPLVHHAALPSCAYACCISVFHVSSWPICPLAVVQPPIVRKLRCTAAGQRQRRPAAAGHGHTACSRQCAANHSALRSLTLQAVADSTCRMLRHQQASHSTSLTPQTPPSSPRRPCPTSSAPRWAPAPCSRCFWTRRAASC